MSKRMVDLKVEDGKVASINGFALVGSGGSGGESYNVAVTSGEYTMFYKGNIPVQWNGGHALKPNTAYKVGDQVQVYASVRFNNKKVLANQILAPSLATLSVSADRTKMQFGDVILVLTNTQIVVSSDPSTVTDQNYQFTTENYLTYTVVKDGTTGESVALPSTGFDAVLKYMLATLEATKAVA